MQNSLNLTPGQTVEYQGQLFLITYLLDLDTVLAESLEEQSAPSIRLYIRDLKPAASQIDRASKEEEILLNDEDWQEANRRFLLIRPLINNNCSKAFVREYAHEHGVTVANLNRWIKMYLLTGRLSLLISKTDRERLRKVPLTKEIDDIINDCIQTYYLKSTSPSIKSVLNEVAIRCQAASLEKPHPITIRNRIAQRCDQIKLKKVPGPKKINNPYSALLATFPGSDFPLSVVQIDHMAIDLIIVDEISHKPIGNPWITVAIDLFSRMIIGFDLSMNAPTTISVGSCLIHSILPKDSWLLERGISAFWPCWGLLNTICIDKSININDTQINDRQLKRVCVKYGMNLKTNSIATKNFGQHIKRLLDTFSEDLATFCSQSNSHLYKNKSEGLGKIELTILEFEVWLANLISDYHKRLHSTLQTSPLSKYETGVWGSDTRPGTGLKYPVSDIYQLKLDLLL